MQQKLLSIFNPCTDFVTILYFLFFYSLSGQVAKKLAVPLIGATSISIGPTPGCLGRLLSPVTTIQGKEVIHSVMVRSCCNCSQYSYLVLVKKQRLCYGVWLGVSAKKAV